VSFRIVSLLTLPTTVCDLQENKLRIAQKRKTDLIQEVILFILVKNRKNRRISVEKSKKKLPFRAAFSME
jgi:hypothetical protein